MAVQEREVVDFSSFLNAHTRYVFFFFQETESKYLRISMFRS